MQSVDAGIETVEVVIVGSGFGGLSAAKQLNKSGVPYVLISSTPNTSSSLCSTKLRRVCWPPMRSRRPSRTS